MTSAELPVGTVTFLLTDIESSSQAWEADPGSMSKAVARHYEILDETIARHGGARPHEQKPANDQHTLWHNYEMKRTTIVADDQTIGVIKRIAMERGVSFAEIVREALADKAREFRPKPKSLGIGKGLKGNTAQKVSDKRIPPRPWR